MKQLRANKRQETLLAKRSLGIDGSPPHVIVRSAYMNSIPMQSSTQTAVCISSTWCDPVLLYLQVCLTLNGDKESSKELHSLLCSAAGEDGLPFSTTTTVVWVSALTSLCSLCCQISVSLRFTQLKKRITFIFPPAHDLYSVLDITKVHQLSDYHLCNTCTLYSRHSAWRSSSS